MFVVALNPQPHNDVLPVAKVIVNSKMISNKYNASSQYVVKECYYNNCRNKIPQSTKS